MFKTKRKRQLSGEFNFQDKTFKIAVQNFLDVLYPTAYAELIMESLIFTPEEKHNSVIDLGTGSGVLGIFALLSGCENVTMTDISPSAIKCASRNLRLNNIDRGFEIIDNSDLFERLGGRKFNVIICNPPPLPDIPELQTGFEIDGAILSGPDGMHFISRFLKCFDLHLSEGGRLVFTHPSFWSLEKTLSTIKTKDYSCKVLAKKLLSVQKYPHFTDRQHEALIKRLTEISNSNGSRFFSVPGTEFSLSVYEVKKKA
jgi:release factor glutamine methyltransferase